MTPWGILSPDQFRPLGPPALHSEQYLTEFNEVKTMGSPTSKLRSADQTDACLFWAATSGTYVWNRAAIDLGEAHLHQDLLAAADRHGIGHGLRGKGLGDGHRFRAPVNTVEQDREFVAPEAGEHIPAPDDA